MIGACVREVRPPTADVGDDLIEPSPTMRKR
jgi:hypothetical protein